MTVALSSLRVVTEGDSSSYVKSMADVASSSDKATESVGKFTDAQGNQVSYLSKTGDALSNASTRFERLQRSLDPTYASQVRLTQAQTTLQGALDRGVISTDRYNELMAIAGQRFEDTGRKAGPLGKVFEGISGQLIALSAGAGPVGVALAAFGPIGLAAAVGIGAAVEAFHYLSEEANRFGEASSKLHDLAETAGVTSVQMKVLEITAAGVGVTTDKLEQSFERFSFGLSELQKGQGPYDQMRKINSSLTDQLAITKDVIKAWDLLATAYEHADVQEKALITHAFFGRGGAGVGRVLSATAEAGGSAGLQAKISPSDIIDDATTAQLGLLKTQLDQVRAATRDIWASMFSEDVLEKEKRTADYLKKIAENAKEIWEQDRGKSWIERMVDAAAQLDAGAIGASAPSNDMENARARIARGGGTSGNVALAVAYPPSLSNAYTGRPQEGPQQESPELALKREKDTIAALGSAATAYEQLKVKIDEVNFAEKNHILTETEAGRARAALRLDTVIALEGQRLGLLGELAPVSEIVAQKENQIAAARTKGVDITKAEAAAIKFLTEVQTESARLQEKIAIGTVSETEIRANLAKVLEQYKTKKLLDPNDPQQLAAANVVLGKSFEKMSEQAQLARAPLEQLKKWEIDAGNFRLQVDTASVSTLNQMTTSIVDFTTGTKTASAAFQDFGKSVIKILEEMIVKMLLARALQAALGGLGLGGGGAPTSNPYSGMPAGSNPTFHGGGMMDEPSGYRSVHPAAFFNAPRAHSGIGPDEMPVITRRDEGIFTPGQMRALQPAGGGSTQVNVYNQADNSHVTTSKRRQGGVEITDVIISTVNKHMANGGFDGPLRARTGTQLQPRGR